MTKKKRESIDDMIDAHVWMAKQYRKGIDRQQSLNGTSLKDGRISSVPQTDNILVLREKKETCCLIVTINDNRNSGTE
jgi:hypothetical protein